MVTQRIKSVASATSRCDIAARVPYLDAECDFNAFKGILPCHSDTRDISTTYFLEYYVQRQLEGGWRILNLKWNSLVPVRSEVRGKCIIVLVRRCDRNLTATVATVQDSQHCTFAERAYSVFHPRKWIRIRVRQNVERPKVITRAKLSILRRDYCEIIWEPSSPNYSNAGLKAQAGSFSSRYTTIGATRKRSEAWNTRPVARGAIYLTCRSEVASL